MHTVGGGFKTIHDVDYNEASTVSITGKTTTNHVQIRIDLVKPVHCNQTIPGCSSSSGDEHAINVVEDITKVEFSGPILPSDSAIATYGIMTEEPVIREKRIYGAAGRGDSDSRMTSFEVIMPLKLQSTKILT